MTILSNFEQDAQIFDEDPDVRAQYIEAAKDLNKTGCLALKKSVELMRKHEENLILAGGGVTEVFHEKDEDGGRKEKTYETTEKECNCTRWIQDSFPCRHILFFRRESMFPLYDKNLFADYFHKERKEDMKVAVDPDVMSPVDDYHHEEEDGLVLEPEEKFRLARDSLHELQDLLCHFGTQEFREYLWELEIIKRKVRRGVPMIRPSAKQTEVSKVESKDDSGDDDVDRLEFEKKVRRRGRPKYTKAGKLQFPKPKTSNHPQVGRMMHRYILWSIPWALQHC